MVALSLACTQDRPRWWGTEASEDPCRLALGESIASVTGTPVLSSHTGFGDYETWCEYELGPNGRVRIEIFHADQPGFAQALRDPSYRVPHEGAGDVAAYQPSLDALYYRALDREAGIDVSVSGGTRSEEERLQIADHVATDAFTSLDRFR